MDLITELIKVAKEHHEKGNLIAAAVGFAQVVKILRKNQKIKKLIEDPDDPKKHKN